MFNCSQVVINKGMILSALAVFMTAQMVSTNIAVWIYALVVETVDNRNNTGSHISTTSQVHMQHCSFTVLLGSEEKNRCLAFKDGGNYKVHLTWIMFRAHPEHFQVHVFEP
jgi:hypothetical protein